MDFNRLFIGGNLTRDPELTYTPKGTAVAKLGIAINRKWKSDTGEEKSKVTFVDVDAFGKTAENVAKFFKKGRPIFIEGHLELNQWEKDGKKFSRLVVQMDGFQFCGGDKPAGDQPANQPARPAAVKQPGPAPDAPIDDPEDDVPF